jgi:hypothetical protein
MSKEDSNLVEVEWSGKKLLLKQEKLDEWLALYTDDQKVGYVNSHPEIRNPTNGGPVAVHRTMGNHENRSLQEPDDLVLVHWSGVKVGRVLPVSKSVVLVYT